MILFIYIYIFIFGLFFGSFYSLIGYRLPKKESIMGRSYCETCGKKLGVLELFPLLGFIIFRGKCRTCKSKISIIYPTIELITGLLFLFSYILLKDNILEFVLAILFMSMMVIVTTSDILYKVVPDKILIIFLPIIFVFRILSPINKWYDGIIGGILGFLILYFIGLYGEKRYKKTAMGGGDIKLYGLVGLFLGYNLVFLSLFFASISGLLYGFVLRKEKRSGYLPFVPFIFLGTMLTYFYGDIILTWYFELIG